MFGMIYKESYRAFLKGYLEAGGKKNPFYHKIVERGRLAPSRSTGTVQGMTFEDLANSFNETHDDPRI